VKETRLYLLMLLPAVVALLIVVVLPLTALGYISLLNWELRRPGITFAGAGNYIRMLRDPDLLSSTRVTAWFVVGAISLQVVLGLVLAEILVVLRRTQTLVRTLILLPMVIPPLVAGIIWRILLEPRAGLVNHLLGFVGLRHAWLADPNTALAAVIVTDVWQWTPLILLLLLARYAVIPTSIYDAAAVDGATGWTRFFFITLPLVRPVLVAAVVLRMIDAIREFAKIFIMTGGGPGVATETINMYVYRVGFTYGNLGYAAALGVLLFAIVLVLTLTLTSVQKRFEVL
jgi:multiple sugar transport system permease protein